jgi:hypothetical protein
VAFVAQAKAFVEQRRLGLASQFEFKLDASALSQRKADTAGIAAWPDEDNDMRPFSDDDFDVAAASQVCCMTTMQVSLPSASSFRTVKGPGWARRFRHVSCHLSGQPAVAS